MAKLNNRQSDAVGANIDFIARIHHIDRKKLASVMGISETAFYKRMKDPETFRMGELERLIVWSTKRGYPVSLAQICEPFVPASVEAKEVPA